MFPFGVRRRYALPLVVMGVWPGRARVEVGGGGLRVDFGVWGVRTPLANVESVRVSGPLSWWRAIGVRLSLADRGLTFGSSAGRGVCFSFREPVRLSPLGVSTHPGLTVTVADPEGLVSHVARLRVA
ncbi:hypothetical protein ACOBQX_01545 [Actinokineospora sp. G85]|uniref:hypothetical protein n=1 Tax=Actinokineospora sp. G85 TaxID=3406626 RepID=UPI003C7402A5